MLTFTVYGVAQPKGSARAFMPKGARYPVVTSDNPKNKGWQQLIAEAASRALAEAPEADRALLVAGVRLTAAFYLPAPKKMSARAVRAHLTRPDLDKLVRSCKDALTRVLWADDGQVIELIASKHYAFGTPPRAEIRVEPTAGVIPLEEQMYDRKCEELARIFLSDEDPTVNSERSVATVAQAIQDAIESSIDDIRVTQADFARNAGADA